MQHKACNDWLFGNLALLPCREGLVELTHGGDASQEAKSMRYPQLIPKTHKVERLHN